MVSTFVLRDGDGILDFLDNCPSYANGDQSDIDGDGAGISNFNLCPPEPGYTLPLQIVYIQI